ncbi:hypothetical protein J7I94_10010 [Streptomyces sp. ISL-12]|uniref:hypothetical protein n=1 Tax=Streptomyces sp. ISL-12 TaxID=2819177 RepID=UPI001BE56EA4|nr:hypothetical protein [Streptomyces sp. ISL-12]MBT2410894.1 hypothetical protein [Streptomyces sp. ISL-12]
MGTKTVDETGAATKADEDRTDVTDVTDAPEAQEESQVTEGEAAAEGAEDTEPEAVTETGTATEGPSGVGQGAGAVVSAGLGIVSLTGSWVGTVASARQAVLGQLATTQTSDVQTMLQKGYGDAWQATALWGGVFALVALIVGVFVLARPAFGAPGRPQPAWIKSVSWAGVALGVIGLLLAVLKYTDILLAVPSAS